MHSTELGWTFVVRAGKSGKVFGGLLFASLFFNQVAVGQDFFKQLQDRLGVSSETEPAVTGDESAEDLPAPKSSTSEPAPVSPIQVPAVTPVPTPFAESHEEDTSSKQDRPYLGVTVEQMEGGGVGLRVVQVTKDSPGWKSGITVGDHLLAINGIAVSSLDQLAGEILQLKPGDVVKCLIDRRGRTVNLPVVLGSSNLAVRTGKTAPSAAQPYVPIGPELSEQFQSESQYQPDAQAMQPAGQQRAMLGVTVERLSDSVREQLGIPTLRGAVVQAVAPNSPAQRAGLMPGDCIVGIGGTSVDSDVDLMNWILAARPGTVTELQYHRGRVLQTTKIRLESTDAPVQTQSQQSLKPSYDPTTDATEGRDVEIATLESQLQALRAELERTQAELEALRERR